MPTTAQSVLYGNLPEALYAGQPPTLPTSCSIIVQLSKMVRDDTVQPLGKLAFTEIEAQKRMLIPWLVVGPEEYAGATFWGRVDMKSPHLDETIRKTAATILPFEQTFFFNDDFLDGLANSCFNVEAQRIDDQTGHYHVQVLGRNEARLLVPNPAEVPGLELTLPRA